MQQFQAIDPALLLQYPNIKQELDTLSNEFGLTGDFGLTDDALRQVNGNSLDIPVNLMSPLSTSPHDPTEYPEANDDMMKGGSNGSLNSPFVSSTPIDVKNRQVQNISNGSNTPKMIPGSNNPGFYSMSMPVNSGFGVSASSFGSFGSPSGFGDLPLDDRQFDALVSEMGDARLEIMNERRRRRRESHNAVERRRRDNINEKIQELATLLPDLANDTQNKPNKGVILRRSVDYIRYIQSYTLKLEQRQRELEGAIGRLVPKGRENELGLSFVLGSPIDLVPYYTPGQAPQNTPPPASIQQQQQYQLEQMQFQQFQQQQQQVAQQQMQNQAGMQ
ncbi:hypothetical protein HK098_004573 [Nowakowskiella sp. JEL0407]|nr:hypothetical protein HK098_004573 [Nowakowskiella sp. JEL0407]